MPTPGEHKTVQARILAYAEEIGWTVVSRAEAQQRRGFDMAKATPAEQAARASLYFDDLLDAQVRRLNPAYAEGPGALIGDLRRLHATIAGNRDFLAYLRNARTFYDQASGRELNLVLIDQLCGVDVGTVTAISRGQHFHQQTEEEQQRRMAKHGRRGAEVFRPAYIPTTEEIRRKCQAIHRLGRMRGVVRPEDRDPAPVYFQPVELLVG
jgi:hypothetical protein